MKGIAAAAVAVLAAAAGAGAVLDFEGVLDDMEVRVASYLADTPEEIGNVDRTRDRKALAKALASIHRVQAKPSPLAIAKCVAKGDKGLTKEIPVGEMTGLLDQVASNAFDAAGAEVGVLRADFEALPSSPAGDAALLLVDGVEDALAAAALLPTRAERLKALVKVVKTHASLRKKYAKVARSITGGTLITAKVNGEAFSDSSVFGALVASPSGVVSATFSASEPNGLGGLDSFVFALSTEEAGGFLVAGDYALDADIPVATAFFTRTNDLDETVLAILGSTGFIHVAAIDRAKGTMSGTFQFSGIEGDVTEGTFFLTGLAVLPVL